MQPQLFFLLAVMRYVATSPMLADNLTEPFRRGVLRAQSTAGRASAFKAERSPAAQKAYHRTPTALGLCCTFLSG